MWLVLEKLTFKNSVVNGIKGQGCVKQNSVSEQFSQYTNEKNGIVDFENAYETRGVVQTMSRRKTNHVLILLNQRCLNDLTFTQSLIVYPIENEFDACFFHVNCSFEDFLFGL